MIRPALQLLGFLTLLGVIVMLNPSLGQRLLFLRYLPKVTIAPPEVMQKSTGNTQEKQEKVVYPQEQAKPEATPSTSPSPSPSPKDKRWGIQYKFSIGEQTNESNSK